MEVLDPRPISNDIWEAHVPEGFKPPSLVKFDRGSDPYKYAAFINIQIANIGFIDFMKCKLLSSTFRDAS